MRSGRFEEGLKLYHTALTQVVRKPDVLARVVFNMGLGFLKWEKPEFAVKAFKRAASLDPKFEKAAHNVRVLEKVHGNDVEMDIGAEIVDMGELSDTNSFDAEGLSDDIAEMFGSSLELDDSLFESLAQG